MKYLFFDVDGTLYSHNTGLVPSAKKAIEETRAKGNKCFIATGRHLGSLHAVKDLEVDGIIFCNGGGIYIAGNSQVTIDENASIAKNIALPIGGSNEFGKGGGIYVSGGYLTISTSATIGSSLDTKDYERIKGLPADTSEDASSYELFGSNIANLGGGIYLTNQNSTELSPATVDFKGYVGYNIALKLITGGIDHGAGNGGGIYSERSGNKEAKMQVIGSASNNFHEYPSAVSHNIAEGMGGGLYLNHTDLDLKNNATVSLNNAKTSLIFDEESERYISGEAGASDFYVNPFVNEVYLNYGSLSLKDGGILGEDQSRPADGYYSLSLYWVTTGSFNFTSCVTGQAEGGSATGGQINGDVFIKSDGEISIDTNAVVSSGNTSSGQGSIRLTYLNGLPCEFFEYYNEHHGLNKKENFLIFFAKVYIVDDDIVRLYHQMNLVGDGILRTEERCERKE